MAQTTQILSGYRQIEAILSERRADARRALELRRRRVAEAIPEFESLEYDIKAAGLAYNRALLSGEKALSEALSDMERTIGALCKKRDGLLEKHGFPCGYLLPVPVCAQCGDTGYVAAEGTGGATNTGGATSVGSATNIGGAMNINGAYNTDGATNVSGATERCSCFKQLLFNSLEAASNIVAAGAANFDIFDESLYSDRADEAKFKQAASPRDNICRIRDSAKRFVRAINDGIYENLYFFGQPGTGKTFMAASIANELMRGGTPVLYLSAPTLFNIFSEHRMLSIRDDNYRDTLFRQVFSCKLLIIDDLGIEAMTESRFSDFIALLNARLAPGAYSTIISTNKELSEFKSLYDERILSRVIGSFHIIRFYGDDIRLRRPKAGGT
ncbi:MAG: ATP-binding protein [Oscillospiraceae bacterium]|nr:ATP-binding protein [Oscillospiraceae bacterium]